HLGHRLIDELWTMEHVANLGALRVAQSARARRALHDARWHRWPGVAIQRRAAQAERLARRRDGNERVVQLLDEVHQLSPSSSKVDSAIPRIACAFFCSAMTTSATCSLRSSSALRFSNAAIRRSFASSLGLRPGLRPSRPDSPD